MEEAWVPLEEFHHLSPWPASPDPDDAVLLGFDVGDASPVGYESEVSAGEVSQVGGEGLYAAAGVQIVEFFQDAPLFIGDAGGATLFPYIDPYMIRPLHLPCGGAGSWGGTYLSGLSGPLW